MRYAVAILAACLPHSRADLFISEYGQNADKRSYLEIYNSGDSAVVLSEYEIRAKIQQTTGGVWVMCDGSATAAQATGRCDQNVDFGFSASSEINLCLMKKRTDDSSTPIDCIGNWGVDPENGVGESSEGFDGFEGGGGWGVCGKGSTSSNTLIRQKRITVGALWSESAKEETCQWNVLAQDSVGHLGYHPYGPSPLFFSEYGQNTDKRSYLEIYNSGDFAVSLSDYTLRAKNQQKSLRDRVLERVVVVGMMGGGSDSSSAGLVLASSEEAPRAWSGLFGSAALVTANLTLVGTGDGEIKYPANFPPFSDNVVEARGVWVMCDSSATAAQATGR
ncbi:hypothetical protein M885DRAFT_563009, partial [Pelagophyceae sp. CCMP2097]